MTLKIEVGKYYRTRDGRKVGPMVFGRSSRMSHDGITFCWSDDPSEHSVWADNGCYFGNTERARSHDLIAEWTDEPDVIPPPPPIDLTAITTPDYNDGNWHGWNGGECPVHPKSVVELLWPSIMDETKSFRSTRQADGFIWVVSKNSPAFVFRVVKPYTAPREWWIVGDCEAYDSEADAFDACKSLVGNPTPVHVREVKE